MIPIVLSILFGIAVWLIYDGLTDPRTSRPEPGAARRSGAVTEFLKRAGLPHVGPRDFVLFSPGSGLALGLVAEILLGWPVVSILVALVGGAVPFAYYVRRHDRQVATLQVALVEAIEQLRDSIRAGLSVQDALAGLARHGPEALRPEFLRLTHDLRLSSFESALSDLGERLSDPLADTVVQTLVLNDRLGGHNVSQVLDRLAHATRAQLRIQEEIRAYQARNVLSARIVAAVPLFVLVGVRAVSPRYLAIFDDPWGQLILAGCLVSIAVGYAAMLWLTRLPGERRVLRP